MKLTEKQERFCQNYIEHGNGTKAYIDAGYAVKSQKSASEAASRLLAKSVNIQKRLQELRAPALQENQVTVERIVSELTKIAFAHPKDFYEANEYGEYVPRKDILNNPHAGAVSNFDPTIAGMKIKFNDKNKALGILSQWLGMMTQKIEVKGEVEVEKKINYDKLSDKEIETLNKLVKKASD